MSLYLPERLRRTAGIAYLLLAPGVRMRSIAPCLVAIALGLPFSCCIGGCATWKGWSARHPQDPFPAGPLADLHRKIQAEIAAREADPGDPLRDEVYRSAAIPLLLSGLATLLCTSGLALLAIASWAFRRGLARWAVVVVAAVSLITLMLAVLCVVIVACCEARLLLIN